MASNPPYPSGVSVDSADATGSVRQHAPERVTPLESASARLTSMLQLHFQTVWRALRRFGVPVDLADDAAQEVFMVAARKLATIELGGEQRFLYGVSLRVAANKRRGLITSPGQLDEDTLRKLPSDAPLADELLEEKQLREVLDSILQGLPFELRTVLVLVELESLSAPEVAKVLSIPIGTVASRLRRARVAFHQAAELAKQRWCQAPWRTP